MDHSKLKGTDLHISKTSTGTVSPMGVQTPTVLGELYTNISDGTLWISTGLTNTSWKQISGNSTLTFDYPLELLADEVSIPKADSTHDGYLDSTDWNKFNAGVSFTPGDLISSTGLTVVGGVGSTVTSTGVRIGISSGYHLPTNAEESNWNSAYSSSHAHSNKSNLDTINQNLSILSQPTFAGLTLDGFDGNLATSSGLIYATPNLPKSSGPLTDPVLIDHGNGTATIESIDVNIYSTSDYTGSLKKYTLAEGTFLFTEGIETYVVADYNGGIPIMRTETNKFLVNGSSIFTILICWRQGTIIHSVSEDAYATGLANKINRYIYNTESYKRSIDGGLILSESSTPVDRTIIVSYSIVYAAVTPNIIGDFNSSVDLLTQVNHVASNWVYTNVSVYDNTYYDNGVDLVSSSKYITRWFFRSIGDVKQVFYVLGTSEHNSSALAEKEGMPSIPVLLRNHCMFVGRAIINGGDSTGYIISAFGTVTPASTVINHNDTINIQGGTSTQRYHLSSTGYTIVTRAATSTGDGYLTSVDWSTFNNKKDSLVDNSGVYTAPTYHDNGDGTITIGSGVYNLYKTSDFSGNIYQYIIDGGTFPLVNDTINYILAYYNNGSPAVEVTTTAPALDSTLVPILTIYREDNELYILDWKDTARGQVIKLTYESSKTNRFMVEPDALILSTSTGRRFLVSGGVAWRGGIPTVLNLFNSSTDVVDYWYHIGGVWTKHEDFLSSTGVYINNYYDDGQNLALISDEHYAVNWIFRAIDSTEDCCIVVLGNEDYTYNRSQVSQPVPDMPPFIEEFCVLVGRIAVKKDSSTNVTADSAFDNLFFSQSFVTNVDNINIETAERNSTGLISGGILTYNSTNSFSISAGSGYIVNRVTSTTQRIDWEAIPDVRSLADGINYFAIGEAGVFVSPTVPDTNLYVYVGACFMTFGNTTLVDYTANPTHIDDYQKRMDDFLTGSVRTLIESGLDVTEQANPNELKITIGAGYINTRLMRILFPTTTAFTKLCYSMDYGWVTNPTFPNIIDTTHWNDITKPYGSHLTVMTSGYWKKDLIVAMPNLRSYTIYAQKEYATQAEALAAPLPTIPATVGPAVIFLAFICSTRGDTSIANRLSDLRPYFQRVFGYTEKGVGGSIIHSSLLALDQDDHSGIYYNQTISDTKYAILDGKDGGQTLHGSINTGESLHLSNNAVDALGMDVNPDGSISVNATSYEALVQYDNVLTNKKYVDDVSAALLQQQLDIDSTGLVSGGEITLTGGVTFTIASGVGYIVWNGVHTRVTWDEISGISCLFNGENFICIKTTPAGEGSEYVTASQNPRGQFIELGYIFTGGSNTVVVDLIGTPKYASKIAERVNTWAIEGIRAIIEDGLTVSEQAAPDYLKLYIASGTMHTNLQTILLDATTTFTKLHNTANFGWVPISTSSGYVDVTYWNDTSKNYGAALTEMTLDYWKKDLVFRTPSGQVYYIYGQAEYASEEIAKAAPLPIVPSNLTRVLCYLCSIVSKKGDTSIANRFYDIRPNLPRVFGFGTAAAGSVTSHSSLSNLDFASAGHTGFEAAFNHGDFSVGSNKLSVSGTSTGAVIGTGFTIDVIPGNILHDTLGGLQGGSTGLMYHSDQAIDKTDTPEFADVKITGLATDYYLNNTAKSVDDYITKAWGYNKAYFVDSQSPLGFVNRTDSTFAFDVGTRTFSIWGTFRFYLQGKKYNKVIDVGSPETAALPTDTTGKYVFYYTSTGALKCTVVNTVVDFATDAAVAQIYYNNSAISFPWNGPSALVFEQRPGLGMNKGTRRSLHYGMGTIVKGAGFELTGTYSVASGTGTLAQNSYGVNGGTIVSQDIQLTLDALVDNVGIGNQYPIFYRIGTTEWRWVNKNLPYYWGTNITYNELTGGNYQLTELTSKDSYVNYYLCATAATAVNNDYRFVWVMGQHTYNNLLDARAITFLDLDTSYLPFYDIAPLWRITMRRNSSYTPTTGNARIEYVQDVIGTLASIASTFNIQNHRLLANRSAENVHPSDSISYDNTSSGLVAVNVKDAIDEVITKLDPVTNKGNLSLGSNKLSLTGSSTGVLLDHSVTIDVNQSNFSHNSLGGIQGNAAGYHIAQTDYNNLTAGNFQFTSAMSNYLGTAAATNYRYTSADSQLQFTSANSNLLGTGAAASFRYTSADSQLQFTSKMSDYQLLANSSLSLGTGAAGSFQYTSGMSNYQLVANSSLSLGTGATQSFQHTSAMSNYLGIGAAGSFQYTSANSLLQYVSNSGNSLGTGAAASFQYTSANSLFQYVSNSGNSLGTGATASFRHTSADSQLQFTSKMSDYQLLANSTLSLGTGAAASFQYTSANSLLQYVSNSGNSLGTGAAASFRYTSADSLLQFTSGMSNYQVVANSTLSLGTGAAASFRYTSNDSLLQLVANSGNSLGTGATASFQFTTANSLFQYVSNSGNSLGTGAAASFQYTSANSLLQYVSNSGNSLGTGAAASFVYTSYSSSFALRTHIHGNLALVNLSGSSASDGLSLTAGAPGGGTTISHWEPYMLATSSSVSSFNNASIIFNTFNLQQYVAISEINLVKSFNIGLAARTSVNSRGSNGYTITQGVSLFKRSDYGANSSILSCITTASGGMSYSHTYSSGTNQAMSVSWVTNSTGGTSSWNTASASNAFTSYWTGLKYFPIPLVTTLAPGEYWIAQQNSSSTASSNSNIIIAQCSHLQMNMPTITMGSLGFDGTVNAAMNGFSPAKHGNGYASAITTNGAMNMTNISINASSNFPYFVFQNW